MDPAPDGAAMLHCRKSASLDAVGPPGSQRSVETVVGRARCGFDRGLCGCSSSSVPSMGPWTRTRHATGPQIWAGPGRYSLQPHDGPKMETPASARVAAVVHFMHFGPLTADPYSYTCVLYSVSYTLVSGQCKGSGLATTPYGSRHWKALAPAVKCTTVGLDSPSLPKLPSCKIPTTGAVG